MLMNTISAVQKHIIHSGFSSKISVPKIGFGVLALVAASYFFVNAANWVLTSIGLLIGVALYHAAFGFSHGFRIFLAEGRGSHVRAQLLMLALAVALFLPALSAGELFGSPVRGFVFPLSLGLVAGAFLFGIGMQIGGGCASGTLYTVGGGSVRMVLTLASAIAGATIAAYTFPVWGEWPSLPGVSLLSALGLWPALALHAAIFGGLYWFVTRRERNRRGQVEPIWGRGRLLTGPWPYAWAAVALAVLNFATLAAVGRPWGVTQAFALWGSKAIESSGLADPAFWAFWEEPTRVDFLMRPLTADATTIMNVAVMTGALLAAWAAARFAPSLKISLGEAAGSVVGGLLIGFGAIMATGCNISAFFSGVASGSLHGWIWIAAALPGTWLGLKLRPLFGLSRSTKSP